MSTEKKKTVKKPAVGKGSQKKEGKEKTGVGRKKSPPRKPVPKADPKKRVFSRVAIRKGDATQKIAVARKRKLPTFRGRFGNKYVRNIKRARWKKWRHPRGIDIVKRQEDGALPVSGYRTPRAIRGLHPSGLEEVQVHTVKDLKQVGKAQAVRIAARVGIRKRKAIVEAARKDKIPVLNRGGRT